MKRLPEIHNTMVLSNEEITKMLTAIGWSKIIEAVAETFREEAYNNVISPAKTVISFEDAHNDFRVMPSYMNMYPDFCGVKIIGACADNPKKYNLPHAMGTYILNNKWTQEPLLMFNAAITTAWRTAAATAVGVDELSDSHATTLGIIGCGFQAPYHIAAIKTIRNITKVLVCDLDESKMDALLDDEGTVQKASKEMIFAQADIVVTMTPTTKAHMFVDNIPHRPMLICAVGGDSEKKMEFHPNVLQLVDHFCDSLEQVSHTGTVYTALHDGLLKMDDLKSLGGLMISDGVTRLNSLRPVKMFLSTGVALEDLAIARLLYDAALKQVDEDPKSLLVTGDC
jgi:ornithine cyclodeaminase/alanine dehydrogenase-like protein (mu-crystallin family)